MERTLSAHHERRDAAGRAYTRMAGAVIVGLLLTLGLAACGISGIGGAGGASGTPTAAGGTCGTVANGPRPVQNTPAAQRVEQCFAAAFTQCRAATLLYTQGGIDAVTTHALAVVPQTGSGCHITDTRQTTLAGSDNKGPTATVTCTAAAQEATGLRISGCQDGQDFTVAGASGPKPVLSPVPPA